MRSCITSFVVALILLGGLCVWLYLQARNLPQGSLARKAGEAMQKQEAEIPARGPQDYHMLQSEGGIPLAEAERAGLRGGNYSYLAAMQPIQINEGVVRAEAVKVRGNNYDLGYAFESTRPQSQYLEYNLNGDWKELHFGLGFDDSHASDPEGRWSIEFVIQADGKEVFGPVEITPVSEPTFMRLDVSGVNRLTFISRRMGQSNPFRPVLLDPFVLNPAEPAEATNPAEPK